MWHHRSLDVFIELGSKDQLRLLYLLPDDTTTSFPKFLDSISRLQVEFPRLIVFNISSLGVGLKVVWKFMGTMRPWDIPSHLEPNAGQQLHIRSSIPGKAIAM